MKHLKRLLGALLAACLLLSCAPFALAAEVEDVPLLAEAETADAEYSGYVVKLREQRNRMRLQSRDPALQPIAYAGSYYTVQTLDELRPYLEAGLVESLDANLKMELFDPEPPTALTNDPDVARQWYLEKIHAPALWNGGHDGSGVTVALIDSGVADTHEDLVGASITGRNFCGEVVDGVQQYTDLYQDTNGNGHGTFVTGMLTARRNNGKGVAGLLDNVHILSLRCFSPNNDKPQDKKGNYVDTIISAVGYAMEQGADVINMSLGIRQEVPTLESKLREAANAGIILVAAAGNYGVSDPNAAVYPACYDFVVSVGATRSDDLITESSQKNDQVTVAAPGNAIWSTSKSGGYAELSGTSLASPIVAALAAVVKQKDKKIDYWGFEQLLKQSAIDKGDAGKDKSYGWGIVDAQTLLTALDDEYLIAYQPNGGTMPAEYRGSYRISQDVGAELPTPTRGNHDVFVGWYLDEALTKGPYTTLPAGCAGSITLWGAWKQEQLDGAAVKLVGLSGIDDVTATQGEDGAWTAQLPDGTTAAFIAALAQTNIEITGVEASAVTRTAADGTKWTFTVGDTPYVLNIPVPKPLRLIETWEGAATPASLDGKTGAVACSMPVGQWFRGDVASIAKATADLPKEMGTLGVTADRKTMIFTPSAAAAGQTLTARIYGRNTAGLSEPVTATIVVGELPASYPELSVTEALFQKDVDGDLKIGMSLYGSTLADVTLSGGELPDGAYSIEGETLTLKAEWMNALTYGDYTLNVSFSNDTSATLTIKVRAPKPTVAVDPATRDGAATPASLDAAAAVVPYVEEDVSAWFGGNVDEYLCDVTDGAGTAAVEGAKLTYTPAFADGEKNVTLSVRAKNGTGESDPVIVTVAVAAAPLSDPKIESTGLDFKMTSKLGLAARVTWNGAKLARITCDKEDVDAEFYTVSEQDNTITFTNGWLKTRSVGEHTLRFFFTNCRTENLILPLTLTVTKASSAGTGSSVINALISGMTEVSALGPSLTIPEANVTIFYTPDGGRATIDVDDTEAARLAQCDRISVAFPAGDVLAAQLSERIYRAPKLGTIVKFPSGSFFVRSTAPVSGDRTFSISSPSQNVWYLSFTGDPAGVTALLPCAPNRWKATLRTAQGERELPCVYDTKEGCLRVVLPESGTLTISPDLFANPFQDVPAGAWYYDAVQAAYSAKLLQGVSQDTYAPDIPVSRAMLVTILWRLTGQSADAAASFTDVAAGTWYASAAAWGQKKGWINGYPDGTFRPDAPVSRQELMTILWRFAATQGAAQESAITALADFADADAVADYAKAAVSGMVAHGIVNGTGTNPARLAPDEGATRAQLAVILQRFVEHLSGK